MRNLSTSDAAFAESAAEILSKVGEIACVIRFSHAAGSRSFEFFGDLASFRARLLGLPPKTSVILFCTKQFPIRGIANDRLMKEALSSLPDGEWWTLVRTSLITRGKHSWYHDIGGDTLIELEDELKDSWIWGHPVALGQEPDWHNLEETLEAIVPEDDGEAVRGIY